MAPTQHDPTDEQWQTRFEHARELLNNVQREAELAHLVAQAHHATELTALCVYGASALARERRVGLLAGSYNPLTVAHVALAEAARHAARLDTLVWGVAAVTVDKEQVERASLPARLAQLQAYLACSHSPAAGDALVIFNHGLYVEQAQALRRLLAAEAELTIIVGFDKIVQILDPRYYENREQALARLFALARLLVAPRADQSEAALAALLAQPANQPYARFIDYCPLDPRYAIDSSTEARALAASLSPDEVMRSPILRHLLTPEGLALAQTGAYVADAPAKNGWSDGQPH